MDAGTQVTPEVSEDAPETAAPAEAPAPAPEECPEALEIRAGNLVVEGVLIGVREYAVRPVPANGYAARRLRARTFRAAALCELMAQRVAQHLSLQTLLSTGGRFLLAGPAEPGWEEVLHSLRREFDAWLFQHLQPPGQLQCLLAGAVCEGDRLPAAALEFQRAHLRLQPLEGALRSGLHWNGRAFVQPAGPHIGLCAGCASVTQVRLFGVESLCESCAAEGEAGELLCQAASAWVVAEPDADMPGPGLGLRFSQPVDGGQELRLDGGPWPLLCRLPAATFEELAARSPGRQKLLGYLMTGVDGASEAFHALAGDPRPTLTLARRLHGFFLAGVHGLLTSSFPSVFPVYAGGADALLIGPWQETLDCAVGLRREFLALGTGLTLSAGLAVAPPEVPLAAAVEQAGEQLDAARRQGGNRLQALGASIPWNRATSLVATGQRLAEWVERGALALEWLERLADVRRFGNNGDSHRSARLDLMLRHARIRHRQAHEWAARLAHRPGSGEASSDWKYLEFLARYAALARAVRAEPALEE